MSVGPVLYNFFMNVRKYFSSTYLLGSDLGVETSYFWHIVTTWSDECAVINTWADLPKGVSPLKNKILARKIWKIRWFFTRIGRKFSINLPIYLMMTENYSASRKKTSNCRLWKFDQLIIQTDERKILQTWPGFEIRAFHFNSTPSTFQP